MTLIEGIGDEVTHFFIGLITVLIISLSWWTTSTNEQIHVEPEVQTAYLLFRRRLRAQRRLTNHVTHSSISEGTSTATNSSGEVSEETLVTLGPTPKPPEPSTSTQPEEEGEEEDEEQHQIVEAMDDDACVLRQRRLAFYEREASDGASPSSSDQNPPPPPYIAPTAPVAPSAPPSEQLDDIKIRLKYINDDQKLVSGKLREPLGDFKKRHFQGELTSNKLVRLIFNGQVLHQDTKTLQSYGLFDNCVVHCLVHQRRASPHEEVSGDRLPNNHESVHNRNHHTINNNQGRDWDLGNFLFALITFTLLSAWYFRYVYSHLYTVTATVGLIMMTGVFSILLFGFYFPDQDPEAPRQQAEANQPS